MVVATVRSIYAVVFGSQLYASLQVAPFIADTDYLNYPTQTGNNTIPNPH